MHDEVSGLRQPSDELHQPFPPHRLAQHRPPGRVHPMVNGKIQSFNCYPSGTLIFAQLGVLSNIEAAIARK